MKNQHIPFDTLHIIFSYYEETPEFPLETLLVCQSWNVVALTSKDIWSKFEPFIWNIHMADFWSRHLSR